MSGPTINLDELLPATGEAQPVEGWRGADVDPSELVGDEWIAENTTALELAADALMGAQRFGATGAGWTRDTVRRVAARTGYPVVEAWSSWNRGAMGTVVAPLLHHTATAATAAGDYPTLRVVRDGRADLENSLCMFGLGRSGTIYLISERLSWHAGAGEYGGITDGNGHLAGIEAESDGRSWTAAQIDAYPRLVASILLETGRGAEWAPRHADYALPRGRKTDTSGLDIAALRATVGRYLATPALINRGAPAPVTGGTPDMRLVKPVGAAGPIYTVTDLEVAGSNDIGLIDALARAHGVGVVELHQQQIDKIAADARARRQRFITDSDARVIALQAAVAKLTDSSDLTPAEVEAAVAKALRENVVHVDIDVNGADAPAVV